MPTILSRRAKWSGTVTLTSANTNYSLKALIDAVLLSAGAEIPGTFRELNLQSWPGIDSVGANSNDILVGDSLLSTTNVGYILQSGQSRLYRSDKQNGLMSDVFVRSAGASQKLNVDFASA